MATYIDLVQATEDKLYGVAPFERPAEDLMVTLTTSGTNKEFEMTTPTLWRLGDVAEVPLGSASIEDELMYLTEDHPTGGSTATWERGYRGTDTPTWTKSAGSEVLCRKNPLFPNMNLREYINEVLANDLWPHVWTRQTRKIASVTPSVDQLYDLTAGDLYVEKVYQYDLNSLSIIKELPFGWWNFITEPHSDLAAQPALILKKVYDDNAALYVQVRNASVTGGVANISTQLEAMVPYMAAAKAMASLRMAPSDFDSSNEERQQYQTGGAPRRHYQTLAAEFLRMRNAERLRLLKDHAPQKRYKGHPARVRRLTG